MKAVWHFAKKFKRTKVVTRKWMTSVVALQTVWCPSDFGWKSEDGKYKIKWYNGEVAPRCLDIVCIDGNTKDETDWYYCWFLVYLFKVSFLLHHLPDIVMKEEILITIDFK